MGNTQSRTQTETTSEQSFDDLNKTNVDRPSPEPRPSKKRRQEIIPTNERLRDIDQHVLKVMYSSALK